MQFARQIIGQECSKANILATAVATYRHDVRYFDENCTEPVIVQCFDGEVQEIPKTWHGPKIAVLHDWNPKYRLLTLIAKEVFCIGGFDHPDFGAKGHDISSFPLDTARIADLPTATDYDVVIGGALRENSLNVLRSVFDGGKFKKVALVCHTVFAGTAKVFADLEAFLVNEGAEVVFRRQNMPARVLETLYLSAPALIHLGHCGRGWLHSLAEYRRRSGAVNVYCEKEFGNADIAKVSEVAHAIGNAADNLSRGIAPINQPR